MVRGVYFDGEHIGRLNFGEKQKMKKLSKGRNRSKIKDFTSGPSLIKDSGRLDTSTTQGCYKKIFLF